MIISTEATCDLNEEIINKYNIKVKNMYYMVDNNEFSSDDKTRNIKNFYDDMREGKRTQTSQVNSFDAEEYFKELLKSGEDILHLSFSSALSGSCSNFKGAAEKLNKESKNKIMVVDSLCASSGHGLFVLLVAKKAHENLGLEELCSYAENLKHKICHFFTVNDLKYLKRGGRISKTSAFVGNLLNIKPILHVDNEGRLVPIQKVISRKKSIISLFEKMDNNFNTKFDEILISQADCLEESQMLAKLIKDKYGVEAKIMELGPIIGSHSGPETLALFFVGEKR